MSDEIERKFLVKNEGWRNKAEPVFFRQGYLARTQGRVVRVRIFEGKGVLSIKIKRTLLTRSEYEYEIPLEHAVALLADVPVAEILEKNRYTFEECGHVWEVDEFLGQNLGLIIAEVELQSEDEFIQKPEWLGEEVSKITRYFNSELSEKSFSSWAKKIEV